MGAKKPRGPKGKKSGKGRAQHRPFSIPADGGSLFGTQVTEGPSWDFGRPYQYRQIAAVRAVKYYVCPGCNLDIPPGSRILLLGRVIPVGEGMIAVIGMRAVGSVVKNAVRVVFAETGSLEDMIVAFSVAPTTTNETGEMSEAVAEAVRVVRESGLPNETNSMFTLLEGEWDEVFAVIKKATSAVEAVSPRVSLVIKADIRQGVTNGLTAKVDAVNRHLAETSENASRGD